MEPRISMITLGVRDLERAKMFYGGGLSLPEHKVDSDDVAFFKLTGTWLGLYGRDALAEDAHVETGGDGFPGFALAYNVHSPEEVDEVLQEAAAAGAVVTKEGQKVFWGGYSGYFKDPDGFLWEVAHNPFTWIGPKSLSSGNQ